LVPDLGERITQPGPWSPRGQIFRVRLQAAKKPDGLRNEGKKVSSWLAWEGTELATADAHSPRGSLKKAGKGQDVARTIGVGRAGTAWIEKPRGKNRTMKFCRKGNGPRSLSRPGIGPGKNILKEAMEKCTMVARKSAF